MKQKLFWKILITVAVGTVMLFWLIGTLSHHTEIHMSFIAKEHRETLKRYGKEAERLSLAGDEQGLAQFLQQIKQRENTWAGVVHSQLTLTAGEEVPRGYLENFTLGRSVDWKIHLYFKDNPMMDIRFADKSKHFLIVLPQRMRPGAYWTYTSIALQIGVPFILLCILSVVLYRHMMLPLRELEMATRQFSEGEFAVRVRASLGNRNDELTGLADTFDRMAERTGRLIITQRQLIADLSHELRTPITRIDMAVSCIEQCLEPDESLQRIRRELEIVRKLAEDTLTLAWLENEKPKLNQESVDLADLLDCIVEDARFEYPDRQLIAEVPDTVPLNNTNHRSLWQAIENVVRNALKYTPVGQAVHINLKSADDCLKLQVRDAGPGVPGQHLEDIFKPFFRVEKSRDNRTPSGFGLGLALARRQIQAVGGSVLATNIAQGGLQIDIELPLSH